MESKKLYVGLKICAIRVVFFLLSRVITPINTAKKINIIF